MQFKKKSLLLLISCLLSSVSYAGKGANTLVYRNVDSSQDNSQAQQTSPSAQCSQAQQAAPSAQCSQAQQSPQVSCHEVKNEDSESDSLSDSSTSSSSEGGSKTKNHKKHRSHVMSNTVAVTAAGGANLISAFAGSFAQSVQSGVAIYQSRKDEESSSESSDSSEGSNAKKVLVITQKDIGAQCFTGYLHRKEVKRKNFTGTTFVNLEKQNSKHKSGHNHHIRKRKNSLSFRHSHLNNVTFQDTNFKHIRLRHAHIQSATFNNVALHPAFLKHAYVNYKGQNQYVSGQTSQKIYNHFNGTIAGPITLDQMMQQAGIQ